MIFCLCFNEFFYCISEKKMSIDDNLSVNTAASKVTAIKKVTGKVEPLGRFGHEASKFQKEIQDKSVPELNDLLNRQVKILSNEALLKTLPDKGAKVRAKKDQLEVCHLVSLSY